MGTLNSVQKRLDYLIKHEAMALGHSVWEKTVTAVYVKYDNKKIDEANRKVIDYLNG